MIRSLLCAVFLFASAVHAQEFPALFDVTGVASNDALNVRSAPSGSSEIIATLAYDAIAIEALKREGGWLLVNSKAGAGWASASYLTPSQGQPSHSYPPSCFGAEPFWSLKFGDTINLNQMSDDALEFTPVDGGLAEGRSGRYYTVAVGDNDARLTSIISAQSCSDGMSDFSYGLTINLLIESAQGRQLYTGCCSLVD